MPPFDFAGTSGNTGPVGRKHPKKKSFLSKQLPDPLAEVDYSGNVEKDARAEAEVLYSELKAARSQQTETVLAIGDSEYWFAVCFRDRKTKDAFLAQIKATRLGDKYIDGHALAKLLKVDLCE